MVPYPTRDTAFPPITYVPPGLLPFEKPLMQTPSFVYAIKF